MPERPEMRAERAVAETLIDLLEKYGPSIERLADHFDNLKKTGVTERAGAEVKRRREQESNPADQLVDLLAGALKTKVRSYTQRRR